MNKEEAIDILETIQAIYPKFVSAKRKGRMLLPKLRGMDYERVMEKLSDHAAVYHYAPTLEEIAAHPPVNNQHIQRLQTWREEAAMVPADVRAAFYQKMNHLLAEKTADSGLTTSEAQSFPRETQTNARRSQQLGGGERS